MPIIAAKMLTMLTLKPSMKYFSFFGGFFNLFQFGSNRINEVKKNFYSGSINKSIDRDWQMIAQDMQVGLKKCAS